MAFPGRFLPFSLGSALHPRPGGWPCAIARLRFVGGFLLLAWPIFLILVRGNGWIPSDVQRNIGFIVDLWESDFARAAAAAHIGILVQHSWPQLLYVTGVLLTFGAAYEAREGSLRTLLVFYGATLVGVATLTLIVLLAPVHGDVGLAERITATSWSGASVGCMGIVGALFATARSPLPLLAVWAAVEIFVEQPLLPVLAFWMHVAGFLFGFTVSRIAHSGDVSAEESPSRQAP